MLIWTADFATPVYKGQLLYFRKGPFSGSLECPLYTGLTVYMYVLCTVNLKILTFSLLCSLEASRAAKPFFAISTSVFSSGGWYTRRISPCGVISNENL